MVVELAKKHSPRIRFAVYSLHPSSADKISIRVDSKPLYLLLARSRKIYKSESKLFTNYLNITSSENKRLLFAKCFNLPYVERIFWEKKLFPTYSFVFSNKHRVQFLNIINVNAKKKERKALESVQHIQKSQAANELIENYAQSSKDDVQWKNDVFKPNSKSELESGIKILNESLKNLELNKGDLAA